MAAALLLVVVVATACASGSSGRDAARPRPVESSIAPVPPVPRAEPLFRFAVIGDFGTASSEQFAVAERMCRWRSNNPFRLVFTTGDNIYPGGEPENFRPAFFDPYACLFDAGVQFRSVLGNHDIVTDNGRPELNEPAFGMRNRNYVVRRNGVRVILWESNYSRMKWLRRHAREERGDRWTVVAFHHPVFSPGPHGGDRDYRPQLPRMFARKGVDLVLNGHDHLYARMEPKRRVRYVVTGGGGAGLYGCDNPGVAKVCQVRHHFLYVTVYPGQIRVEAVPVSGPPFDTFITRGRD